MHHNHKRLTYSKRTINKRFGIQKSSLKNTQTAQKRYTESIGLKNKLPSGDHNDVGKPHAVKIGNDMSVKKACVAINCIIMQFIMPHYIFIAII